MLYFINTEKRAEFCIYSNKPYICINKSTMSELIRIPSDFSYIILKLGKYEATPKELISCYNKTIKKINFGEPMLVNYSNGIFYSKDKRHDGKSEITTDNLFDELDHILCLKYTNVKNWKFN